MILEEIRKLIDEASPGPWVVCNVTNTVASLKRDVGTPHTQLEGVVSALIAFKSLEADAKFIAAARTLMPLLLDAVVIAQKLDCWGREIVGAADEFDAAVDSLHNLLKKLDEVMEVHGG